MAVVLTVFLWTTVFTEPWSVALFFVLIVGGWVIEILLGRLGATSRPAAL
jgi:hypothetical protein